MAHAASPWPSLVNPLLRIYCFITTVFTALLDVAQFWKSVRVPHRTHQKHFTLPLLSFSLHILFRSWLLPVAQNLFSWWSSKSPRANLLQNLATAKSFEEWEETAMALDEVLSTDIWLVRLLISFLFFLFFFLFYRS